MIFMRWTNLSFVLGTVSGVEADTETTPAIASTFLARQGKGWRGRREA